MASFEIGQQAEFLQSCATQPPGDEKRLGQVAGETLWVLNLAHLDALEDWLGAKVRERGPQSGQTMMAKLPRWMKASTNRSKVLRGLAQLRELAEKSGLDE